MNYPKNGIIARSRGCAVSFECLQFSNYKEQTIYFVLLFCQDYHCLSSVILVSHSSQLVLSHCMLAQSPLDIGNLSSVSMFLFFLCGSRGGGVWTQTAGVLFRFVFTVSSLCVCTCVCLCVCVCVCVRACVCMCALSCSNHQ